MTVGKMDMARFKAACGFLLLALLALLLCTPARAGVQTPDCTSLQDWAEGLDRLNKWELTPSVQLPEVLRDDQLIPLFGLPLLQWNQQNFTEVDRLIMDCQLQAADNAEGKDGSKSLAEIRQAINASRSMVQHARDASTVADQAVRMLLDLPETPEHLESIAQAMAALRQGSPTLRVQAELDPGSRDAITRLGEVYRSIPAHHAEQLLAQLQRRQALLQQLRREAQLQAQQQALEVLGRVEAAIADLPLSQQGLDELAQIQARTLPEQAPAEAVERYHKLLQAKQATIQAHLLQQQLAAQRQADRQRLRDLQAQLDTLSSSNEDIGRLNAIARDPALQRLPPEETSALRLALTQKRLAIQQHLSAERQQASRQRAEAALQSMTAIEVSMPTDLGILFTQGERTLEQLRQQDPDAAELYAAAYHQRFTEAARAMLPAFSEQLERIPANQHGLNQLQTAVADLTGVSSATGMLQSYFDAVGERAMQLRDSIRHNACQQLWQQIGMTAQQASTPLLGSDGPTTLGRYLCQLSERGHTIKQYAPPGPDAASHTLTLVLKYRGQLQIRLRPAEIAPGERLLTGYEVSDAKQTDSLGISQWQELATNLLDSAKSKCEQLADQPPAQLTLNEQLVLTGCYLQMVPEQE